MHCGDIISLNSDQDEDALNGYAPVNPRDPSQIRFDSGDYLLTSGGPVDLAHAVWPHDQNYIGGAWEVYSMQAHSIDPGVLQTHSFDSNPATFCGGQGLCLVQCKRWAYHHLRGGPHHQHR